MGRGIDECLRALIGDASHSTAPIDPRVSADRFRDKVQDRGRP